MTEKPRTTFDQVVSDFAPAVAHRTARSFHHYVDYDDVLQELYAWIYDRGMLKIERWLEREEQQLARLHFALLDVARDFAQKERARKAGYEPEDDYFYTAATIDLLMPLVDNPNFTGQEKPDGEGNGARGSKPPQEGGDLLAMVIDVRAAIRKVGRSPEHIVEWLGGRRPQVGRRKVMSNSAARAVTEGQE